MVNAAGISLVKAVLSEESGQGGLLRLHPAENFRWS